MHTCRLHVRICACVCLCVYACCFNSCTFNNYVPKFICTYVYLKHYKQNAYIQGEQVWLCVCVCVLGEGVVYMCEREGD